MQMKIGRVLFTGILGISLAGCSNLPGSEKQQGAVIGGATGAAVGAAVTKNRALGAVIGGAVGAAGGYVIGANKDKILGKDKDSADEAARQSEQAPATPEAARAATTADVNSDGFVTMDEVVAMKEAGLTEDQMIERLKATGQVFDLSDEQREFLLNKGVTPRVVNEMNNLNKEVKDEVLTTIQQQ
jgi:osmotically inducible lipoprotein OsmB